ncbi:MAG: MOSC domain-containing protein [Chloroflexi bacterium]|nr:MOSC domain-containing protein [Chloroflexota bacterium]
MPEVVRLYRFPVKGMTPEPRERLRVLASGAIEGDRVLGFLHASAAGAPDRELPAGEWWRKQRFTVLMNTPGLARLGAAFDAGARRLTVRLGDETLAEGAVDGEAGRAVLADAVTRYVRTLGDSSLRRGDALTLVGDGVTPRFHDRGPRHVTLLGSASVAALAEAIGAEVDERRFRMNATIDGLRPWEELAWIGRRVRIGGVEFDVTGPVIRCLATHANPITGERDLEVMQTLTRRLGQDEPTMGVLGVPRAAGEIAVGDAVELSG